jgi:5-methylthioribose kinase
MYHFFMHDITPENALEYLRSQGWIGPGPGRALPLGGGVSNLVLRVVTAEGKFVLKQSRPQLRTRDAWFSDLDRVYREQEVMQLLEPLLPPGTVPRVLFVDRANYVFAMSHAPDNSGVWKETLLSGQVDQRVGLLAGKVLSQMHNATARLAGRLAAFDPAVFIQLRVDPFYRRIQERRHEVAPAVERIIDRMLSLKEALCHGDYSPKNFLTHDQGFTLVDYETGHLGDPTMDLGFFLSHLILKAVKNVVLRQQYFELTQTFWRAYQDGVEFRPAAALERRAVEHFGVCLLARIDGTSPVDYLPEEPKREAVRRLGRAVLLDRPTAWPLVLQLAESQLAPLCSS